MVKKVTGKGGKTSSTSGVQGPKSVQTTGVKDVEGAKATEKKQAASRVRRPTRPMTADEREHLFKLIHEEADKLFGPNGLPESQRNQVENAVRMTIDASISEEEEEKES